MKNLNVQIRLNLTTHLLLKRKKRNQGSVLECHVSFLV